MSAFHGDISFRKFPPQELVVYVNKIYSIEYLAKRILFYFYLCWIPYRTKWQKLLFKRSYSDFNKNAMFIADKKLKTSSTQKLG